jgi:hypothetical protein
VTVVEEVPLYVRDGSRFVLYDARQQHTPPIPVPVSLDVDEVLAAGGLDDEPVEPGVVPTRDRPRVRVAPGRWELYAPRCPHERFRGCKVRGCPGPS